MRRAKWRDRRVDRQEAQCESKLGRQLGAESDELLPAEKLEIIDAQGLQLRGTALRLEGDEAGAATALNIADAKLAGGAQRNRHIDDVDARPDPWRPCRDCGGGQQSGRGRSPLSPGRDPDRNRLPRLGRLAQAPARASPATSPAAARRAEAEAMFREIVHVAARREQSPAELRLCPSPYVDLLLKRPDDPAAVAEIFAATQLMVRPGLAQTQAVLARELSGGGDEASRLFRQSVTLSRQIERARIELARLEAIPKPGPEEIAPACATFVRHWSSASQDQARDPVGAGRIPPLSRGRERGHLARRHAEEPASERGLLPHDRGRRFDSTQ